MKCKHYKGEGYAYKLHSEELCLCDQCNLELARGLFEQLAVQVFCASPIHATMHDTDIDELNVRMVKMENEQRKIQRRKIRNKNEKQKIKRVH